MEYARMPNGDYLAPCDQRLEHPNKLNKMCKLVCDATGHEFILAPEICARCVMEKGTPDPDFIAAQQSAMFGRILDLAVLGFYRADDTKELFKRAVKPMLKSQKHTNALMGLMDVAIKQGRLSKKDAMDIVNSKDFAGATSDGQPKK